jgi:hypothetical protein
MHEPDDPKTTASTDGGESLYGRWSRRKQRQRAGLPVSEPEPAAGADSAPAPRSEPRVGEPPPEAQPELTDDDMPDLDTLGEDDDYSPFLSPGVSEKLRAKALRKLFMSSQFNVLDGLNDYDDDFTTFEPLGDIITSDMRHRMEMEAEKAKARAEEEARALMDADAPQERAAEEPLAESAGDASPENPVTEDPPQVAAADPAPVSGQDSDVAPAPPSSGTAARPAGVSPRDRDDV